ncbi:MAG TPA: O-antigen ligase family protein [Candidatus Polarisedimenticolia bacterium]|nr:O-antigen ligase family protein [Candidatus Polarisedimenticolia bacterium]
MPHRRLPARSLLLCSLVGTAVILPPEMHPIGLALCCFLALVLGLVLLCRMRSAAAFGGLEIAAAVWLLTLLRVSTDRHASGMLLLFILLAATAFKAGREEASSKTGADSLSDTIILLGGVVSLWGLYQVAIGLPGAARSLRAMGQPELDAMVLRAESGRAFGPFPLPADLGIYLAMALPLAFRKLLAEKGRLSRAAGAALAALLLAGIAASRSYGAVLSLGVAALLLLPITRFPKKLPATLLVSGAGAVGTGAFFLSRGAERFSPLALRWRNWEAAASLFLDSPALGAGLGGFGDAVTRVMKTGMNETIFAHNSYLQVAAETGMVGLGAVLLGVALLLGQMIRGLKGDRDSVGRALLCLAPLTFLVHNLFDFSAYLPSLLIPFAAMAGCAARDALPGVPPRPAISSRGGWSWQRPAACVLLLALGLGWGLRESLAAALIRSAKEESPLQAGQAALALGRAARVSPCHPDPPAMLSEMSLVGTPDDPNRLRVGEAWARRAVRLRTGRAYGYYILSLYRLAAGDIGEAYVMLERARDRYPERPLYQEQERRLKEMRGNPAAAGGS